MRWSSTLALLTCLVLPAGAAASPGRASDFEDRVALGAPERSRAVAAPGGPVITPVQRAPRRFDLLGLRWPDRRSVEIEVRTRRDGHRFGPWTHVEDADAQPGGSDPVWTGAADAYQLRLSRPPRGLRAHFVRVRGDPRARTAVAPRTVRQLGSPAIVPRSEWGGDQCAPKRAAATGRVDVAFVHHTVTATEYGPQDSAAMVLAICRYHQGSNGWNDIGYNFLVDRFGRVFEGRAGGIDQAVVGAHTQGFNALSTGVANLGTFEAVEQTPEALASLSRLLAWKLHLHGTPVEGTVAVTSRGGSYSRYPAGATATLQRISGHRDGGLTACPGAALYLQLPQLRTLAVAHAATLPPPATLVTPLTPATPTLAPAPKGTLSLQTPASRIAYGQPAQVGGRLVNGSGDPLGGLEVAVQVRLTTGYRTVTRTRTASDGGWSARVPTSRTRSLRAVALSRGRRVATSPPVSVQVLPTITARAARRVVVARPLVLTGRVRPAKRRLLLAIARQGRSGAFTTVARVALQAGRDGSFRTALRLRRPALYRLRVGFAGDDRHGPIRSADVVLRAVRPPARSASRSGGARP